MKKAGNMAGLWLLLFILSGPLAAQTLSVDDVLITDLLVYHTGPDSVNVWYVINNNSRIGPNPANTSVTCELWSSNKTLYSTALTALVTGKKVSVRYKDRGEGSAWCLVDILSVHHD